VPARFREIVQAEQGGLDFSLEGDEMLFGKFTFSASLSRVEACASW